MLAIGSNSKCSGNDVYGGRVCVLELQEDLALRKFLMETAK